jgi:hypothetical protein
MRIAALLVVSLALFAACGHDAATRMCLSDHAKLQQLIAKKDNTALKEAMLVVQECGHSCTTTANEEACKAYKDATVLICTEEGQAACKGLCEDISGKKNETACALVK